MKKQNQSLIAVIALIALTSLSAHAESWKGKPDPSDVSLGVLTGFGDVNNSGGVAFVGTIAKKIINSGFVPDINNSVWIEAELGPVFGYGTSVISYSTHLRWDFHKDSEWTFYGLGGLGGNFISAQGAATSQIQIFPRFGVGALWNINTVFLLRAEASHELVAVGVNFPI